MALEGRCGVILAGFQKERYRWKGPNLNGDKSFVKVRRELEL